MPPVRKIAATAAVLVVLLRAGAAAEPAPAPNPVEDADTATTAPPPVRVKSPSTLTTDKGSVLRLPARTVILWPETWDVLDAEVRRLQDAETRLEAENRSLRGSAKVSTPRVLAIGAAVLAGIAVGYGASRWR